MSAWTRATPSSQTRPDRPALIGNYHRANPQDSLIQACDRGLYIKGIRYMSPAFVIYDGAVATGKSMPNQGWKFHISAPEVESMAVMIARKTLPPLRRIGAWHKIPKDFKTMQDLYAKIDKTTGKSIKYEEGKFITVYAMDDMDARMIVQTLRNDLPKYAPCSCPVVSCERQVIGLSNVYIRYGAFVGSTIRNPQGHSIPDSRLSSPDWAWAKCPVAVR